MPGFEDEEEFEMKGTKSITFTKRHKQWHNAQKHIYRYDVNFINTAGTWSCSEDFIDEVLESKMSLLFVLKNGGNPHGWERKDRLMEFAKLVWSHMGSPYNQKFEDIRDAWKNA